MRGSRRWSATQASTMADAEQLNASGVYHTPAACPAPACADCLAEVLESLERMLLLPGRSYDNRHFQRFPMPVMGSAAAAVAQQEPTHQRDFVPLLSPGVEAVLRTTLAGPAGAMLVSALGRGAELCELTAITSDPGATEQGLHADACWTETAPRLITMFLALHDILDEELGPTRFCPAAHTPSCFPDDTWQPPPDPYSRTDPRAVEKLAQTPPTWFALHAGDAVLMDSTTWHQGGANTSVDCRRTLLCISFAEPQRGGGSGSSPGTLRLGDFVGGIGGSDDTGPSTRPAGPD